MKLSKHIKLEEKKILIDEGLTNLLDHFKDWYNFKIAMYESNDIINEVEAYTLGNVQSLINENIRVLPIDSYKYSSLCGLYVSSLCNKIVKSDTDIIKIDLSGIELNYVGANWSKGVLEIKGNVGVGAAYRMSNGLIYIKGSVGKYACEEMTGGILAVKDRINCIHSGFIRGIVADEKILINKSTIKEVEFKKKIIPYLLEKIKEESNEKLINDSLLIVPKISVKNEEVKV
jgi:formylmethanofuran dehydrogenase subunit C